MKKFFRNLHIWLSIPFGVIIAIICFTGAMLVFEDDIMGVCRYELYYVNKVEGRALSISQLMEKVGETLPDSVTVTGVAISSNPVRTWQVNLSKPRRASVYVDQYTGEIKGRKERAAFFTVMFRTHRWLLDSMKPDGGVFVGKLVVGISTLMMVIVLISGIVIWVPRTVKTLKNRLKIHVKKGWRRFCYDLHVAGGIYATVFLLVMALTGLTWSFSWYRTAFYQVFGAEVKRQTDYGGQKQKTITYSNRHVDNVGQKEYAEHKGHGKNNKNHLDRGSLTDNKNYHEDQKQDDERVNSEVNNHKVFRHVEEHFFTHWQHVYDGLKKQNPGYEQISITDGIANVSFSGFGNQRAADRYTFDPANGEISEMNLYVNQDKAGKLRGWIYSVHVGNWGGLLTRILTFLAALLGAILPITGYYLWIKKQVGRRRRERLIKIAVSGVA